MSDSGRINPSTLYFGDCLEVMRKWDAEQADLIYLDPPFKSDQNYNFLFRDKKKKPNGKTGQMIAFEDTWEWDGDAAERVKELKAKKVSPIWRTMEGLETMLGPSGMLAYLSYMGERLEECKRLLKPNGSIYLHCDPTASHYLKMVMDAIFGADNFRREIVWDIAVLSGYKTRARNWIRGHDTLLFYSKADDYIWNRPRMPHRQEYLDRFNKVDDDGRKYFDGRGKRRYLDDVVKAGKAVGDVWSDIMSFQQAPTAKEKMGYPTQKPLALLERLIKASSNEGDLILDPFCGCGTSVLAAQNLKRRWAGIDVSAFAVETVMKERLRKAGIPVKVMGTPVDMETAILLAKKPFEFEKWAINQVPGLTPNDIQVGDGGIDGRGTLQFPTDDNRTLVIGQVKASRHVSPESVKAFLRTMETEGAACGVFLTLYEGAVSKNMRTLGEQLGTFKIQNSIDEYPRCQFWSAEEWFRYNMDDRFLPRLPPMRDPHTGKEIKRTLYEQSQYGTPQPDLPKAAEPRAPYGRKK